MKLIVSLALLVCLTLTNSGCVTNEIKNDRRNQSFKSKISMGQHFNVIENNVEDPDLLYAYIGYGYEEEKFFQKLH